MGNRSDPTRKAGSARVLQSHLTRCSIECTVETVEEVRHHRRSEISMYRRGSWGGTATFRRSARRSDAKRSRRLMQNAFCAMEAQSNSTQARCSWGPQAQRASGKCGGENRRKIGHRRTVRPPRDAGLVMRNARPRDVRCCFSVPHTPHGTRAKAHGAGVWGAHSNPRAGATRKCSS